MNLATARARYYDVNHFGADGGDTLAWVPIKVGRVTVWKVPNTEGRREAVKFHDIHHIVTGFQTDLPGESEIAAWELASGCTRWTAAVVLNLMGLVFGAVVWPRRITRAWALGRQTKNFYRVPTVEPLLDRDVRELRTELGLDEHKSVRPRDVATMLGYVVGAPIIALGSVLRVIR